MKIAHLVHNFPPEFQGGTELYLRSLCGLQKHAGHDPVILSGSEELGWRDDFAVEELDGLRVLRFQRMPRGEAFSVDFYLERFEGLLLDFIDAEKPDVLHLHHWMNLSNEILRVAASKGVPSVLTLHDLYAICPRFFMAKPDGRTCGPEAVPLAECQACAAIDYPDSIERLEGEFRIRRESFRDEFAAAGAIVVPSRAHAEPFVQSGLLAPDGFTVIHHGLVREGLEPIWAPNSDEPLRIVTWGNLVQAKGIHLLIEAFRKANDARPGRFELHLHGPVIGDGYAEELRGAAGEMPVDFHGDFLQRSPADLARGMDLAVFPSTARESYSMVLDEAVALGLPVVVSDAGALPERVGEGGLIFPAGDADALARALLDLESDRGRLAVLSGAIRERTWTLADSSRELERIYDEVVERGAVPVPGRSTLRRAALWRGEIARLEDERFDRKAHRIRFSRFREFVPLRDFNSLPGERVVVMAPHPDDEVIGCGGAMALHAGRGDRVTVIHLTDGSGGGALKNLADVRKEEALRAGERLGVDQCVPLDFKDGHLIPDERTTERIMATLAAQRPRLVYAPSPFEIHPDHIATLFLALHALENLDEPFTLLLYEVNEVMVPGFLIDITPVSDKKDAALACFESQIALNDVRAKSMAGARWRTANVDLRSVTHAEAFIEADAVRLRELIARCRELVRFIGQRPSDVD